MQQAYLLIFFSPNPRYQLRPPPIVSSGRRRREQQWLAGAVFPLVSECVDRVKQMFRFVSVRVRRTMQPVGADADSGEREGELSGAESWALF